jgi:hypothetical protein
MDIDELIGMAERAGCDVSAMDGREYQTMWCDLEQFKRFATLIAAAEREACAQVADAWQSSTTDPAYQCECAEVIRRRGRG